MKTKTLVSRYLKSQGVAPKKSELGINFTFEGWNFLFWDDIDDPLFFRLILPGVFDVTDENYEDKHDSGASVWLCFEQVLESTPQVDDLVPRAVQSLLAAADAFNKEMNDE